LPHRGNVIRHQRGIEISHGSSRKVSFEEEVAGHGRRCRHSRAKPGSLIENASDNGLLMLDPIAVARRVCPALLCMELQQRLFEKGRQHGPLFGIKSQTVFDRMFSNHNSLQKLSGEHEAQSMED
jgi:hypothetical protein